LATSLQKQDQDRFLGPCVQQANYSWPEGRSNLYHFAPDNGQCPTWCSYNGNEHFVIQGYKAFLAKRMWLGPVIFYVVYSISIVSPFTTSCLLWTRDRHTSMIWIPCYIWNMYAYIYLVSSCYSQ